jgi:hypothetical protein
MSEWKFTDPPSVAAIVDRRVMNGEAFIAVVSHDSDDGAWQFLSNLPMTEADAAVVSLQWVTQVDPSVMDLADLPLGWRAWRNQKTAKWQKTRA